MSDTANLIGAHLVGSAPFDKAEEMFRASVQYLGDHIKRLPDGEVGERDTWIRWQHKRIGQSTQIRVHNVDNVYVPLPLYEVVDGVTSAHEIEFPNLGYGDAAIESFESFEKLVAAGDIPTDLKFQVGLPTPLSVASFYVETGSRDLFEKAYGRALVYDFQKMLDRIPAERLSIQWEVVSEFALLEGLLENHLGEDMLNEITTRLATLVDLAPVDVEAGIHLCYGDSGHKHFCEPANTSHLVDVANGAAAKASHPIAWLHLPVPRERDDAEYYRPLKDLDIAAETELYLGLVHHTGGQEATQRRIAAASAVVPRFGIATECGFGRRDRETIGDLMDQHAALLDSL